MHVGVCESLSMEATVAARWRRQAPFCRAPAGGPKPAARCWPIGA